MAGVRESVVQNSKKDELKIARDSKQASLQNLMGLYPNYKDKLLKWGEEFVPVLVFEASKSQSYNPESALSGLDLSKDRIILLDVQIAERDRQVNSALDSGKKMFNAPTYTMLGLNLNESGVSMDCGLGMYFDTIGSCAAMDYEFNANKGIVSLDSLPLRKAAHQVSDPILDGSRRSAAIGSSTLLVYKNANEQYEYIVLKRADNLAMHPGKKHVIPASMFQPKLELDSPQNEFTVRQQVLCEYLEELFDMENKIPRKSGLKGVSMVPEGKYLEELLGDNRAQLLFTGIAMDVYNLRPEICTLLLIHDKEWSIQSKGTDSHKKIKLNYEFKVNTPFIVPTPLNAPVEWALGGVEEMVPAGAAAIKLGIKAALEEIKIRGG